jgi:hypothetical protein
VLGHGAFLKERLGLDLEELELDKLVIGGEAAEIGQNLSGLILAAVVHKPTRREGHEDHANEEEYGRGDL